MFQGSELSVKTTGKALVPVLNALGYDLYLPGNWEVVYYKKNMQKLLGALDAPKVCANMYHDLGDGKKGELIFPPYFTWSKLGVKIGFIGMTDHLVPLRQSPNYSKGIIYVKPDECLAPWVQVLREQEQCDFVIVLAHMGLSQQISLANLPECEGVNYIFGGDTLIGNDTKLADGAHVAHCAKVGARCLVAAGAIILGSTVIGDDVWVGPGAIISNELDVGDKAFITLGAVVTRNVVQGEKVSGNFAIPHARFLEQLKAIR